MNSLLEPEIGPASESHTNKSGLISVFDADEEEQKEKESFVLSDAEPQTLAETVRGSGLAYSAAIALFASVVFMLIIGWGADLLLGSSPWGIVAGIVIGALIGFVQFFRITSQIYKK